MEGAAGQQQSAGSRSLARPLARALSRGRPQERPGCPPASAGGSKAEARVLVINTGGTIGMVQDVKGEEGGLRGGAGRRRRAPPSGYAAEPALVWGGGLGDAPLVPLRLPLP